MKEIDDRHKHISHTTRTTYEMLQYTYLTAEWDFEKEIQNRIGQTQAQGMLQIHFVALEHIVRILGTPIEDDPD